MREIANALSDGQMAGLRKVGDVLVPGDGELASFTGARAAEHVDRMLASMRPADRDSLKLLLGLCRFVPAFAIRALLRLSGAREDTASDTHQGDGLNV